VRRCAPRARISFLAGIDFNERLTTMQGKMLWFNEQKEHGFILTDEGERL